MRRLFLLGTALLALLALSACAEPRPRGPGAFDEVMRQLQESTARPALPSSIAGEAAPWPGMPAALPSRRAGTRRTVVEQGMATPGGRGAAAGAAAGADGTMTLNFVEAPLPQVVQAVLGDLLQADYTLDPRVTGTVTLQTQRPVSRDAAVALLEAALDVNGAALLRGAEGFRVVPAEAALQAGPPVGVRAAGARRQPGFAIVALPLANARAAELQRVLQPLAPRGGAVVADEARNVLLLAGSGPQLASLIETAESFDLDWLRGQSIALVTLENAPAAQVAQEVATLFASEGGRSPVRIVPVTRMNALLLVAQQPQQLTRAQRWIRELDTGMGGGPQLFVHRVQYVRASDLANTLRQLLQTGSRAPAAPLLAPGMVGVTAVAGGTVAVAPGGAPGAAGGAGGVPAAAGGGAVAAEAAPDGATPAGLPPGLGGTPGLGGMPGGGGEGGLPAAPIRVVADEAQNALIVYASQTDWWLVERAILMLDRPPNQVAIDAVIAEVTLNDDLEFGLTWFFRTGNFAFNLIPDPTGAPNPIFPGFNILYAGGVDARVVLRALSSITEVRVISSPQVMVLSNQTARLRVGDSVPIVTQQAVGGGLTDNRVVNSIQLRDTGVSLDVTPRVNASGGVLLEVDQDVSDAVRTTTSGIDSPTIQQRRLRSVVSVPNGETVALGGLIREADQRSRTGLPFTQDIPVLRELLGVTNTGRRRTELLVLLTPRVVQNTEEMRRVTDELRLRMQSMRPTVAPR